jgi:hypothetical protein
MAQNYTVDFNVGDVACVKLSAQNGLIEKVAIKEVRVLESASINQISIMYKDSFNQLWNNGELITYSAAKTIAQTYLNARIADL